MNFNIGPIKWKNLNNQNFIDKQTVFFFKKPGPGHIFQCFY